MKVMPALHGKPGRTGTGSACGRGRPAQDCDYSTILGSTDVRSTRPCLAPAAICRIAKTFRTPESTAGRAGV